MLNAPLTRHESYSCTEAWFSCGLKTREHLHLAGWPGQLSQRWRGESSFNQHMDTWLSPFLLYSLLLREWAQSQKHSIFTPILIPFLASHWVGTQAGLLGWLVTHLEKRNICFHAPILELFILGPFQPFPNVLFNPASVSSPLKAFLLPRGCPFILKSLPITQTKPRLDIPKLWNQQISFEPCWWLSGSIQEDEDKNMDPGPGCKWRLRSTHAQPQSRGPRCSLGLKSSGPLVVLTTPGHLECKQSKRKGFSSQKPRQQLVLAWGQRQLPSDSWFRAAGKSALPCSWPPGGSTLPLSGQTR